MHVTNHIRLQLLMYFARDKCAISIKDRSAGPRVFKSGPGDVTFYRFFDIFFFLKYDDPTTIPFDTVRYVAIVNLFPLKYLSLRTIRFTRRDTGDDGSRFRIVVTVVTRTRSIRPCTRGNVWKSSGRRTAKFSGRWPAGWISRASLYREKFHAEFISARCVSLFRAGEPAGAGAVVGVHGVGAFRETTTFVQEI